MYRKKQEQIKLDFIDYIEQWFNLRLWITYIIIQIPYFILWNVLYWPGQYSHNTVPISDHNLYIIFSWLFFIIPFFSANIIRIIGIWIKKTWIINLISGIIILITIYVSQIVIFLAMFLTIKP